MAINLKRMTAKQLEKLSADLEAHRRTQHQNTVVALRAKITAIAKAEGVALDELFPHRGTASTKRRKVAAKYRNPQDHSQTWSGRGRQPHWYAAAVKAGKSERSLLIK
jgi:DNA-binding protein H-NS